MIITSDSTATKRANKYEPHQLRRIVRRRATNLESTVEEESDIEDVETSIDGDDRTSEMRSEHQLIRRHLLLEVKLTQHTL